MSTDQRPPNSTDEFLTVAEVAKLLKVNPQTVRNWIDQGKLPAMHVGRRVRITRADLGRVIQEGYSPGGAALQEDALKTARGFWEGEDHALPETGQSSGSQTRALELGFAPSSDNRCEL